jgi:hypothetical protein
MLLPYIESTEQITDARALFLAGITQRISTWNDFDIENFADSLTTNPDVQEVLQSADVQNLLKDESSADADLNIAGGNAGMLALSFLQESAVSASLWPKLRNLFGRLRRIVKRVFCKVIETLGAEGTLDTKAIIKQVLVALIPALAAASGLMPVALPIVISLAAMLLKYGVSKVCPV